MRFGGNLLTVLVIAGTPVLALIVLAATGAATPLGATIAIGLTLLVAGGLALLWTRDLTVTRARALVGIGRASGGKG